MFLIRLMAHMYLHLILYTTHTQQATKTSTHGFLVFAILRDKKKISIEHKASTSKKQKQKKKSVKICVINTNYN